MIIINNRLLLPNARLRSSEYKTQVGQLFLKRAASIVYSCDFKCSWNNVAFSVDDPEP